MEKRGANYFNLQRTEIPDEFIIKDYNDLGTTETVARKRNYKFLPTFRYLKVDTHLGYHHGPLSMRNSVDMYYCRLKLRPRLFDKKSQVNMTDFLNGVDRFYICTSRWYGKTGYLYLRDRGEGTETPPGMEDQNADARSRYILACKPLIKRGNSDDDLMLFRLVRFEDMHDVASDSKP